MSDIDVIFFDVDGTIVDARQDIVNAMNYALRSMGLPEKSFDEVVSRIGTGVKDLVKGGLGTGDNSLVGRAVEIYGDYYVKHPADKAKLYPNVKETLEYFKNKKKLILTNRYAVFADALLKAMGIRKYFEDIIGGDNENCIKPSACILDPYFVESGDYRQKTLIVGDMAIDVETGKNSNTKTCWVTYGLGKREDVEPLRPDFIINDMAELKKIIN